MVDIFRFTEIAEDGAAILNPFPHDKLMRLGDSLNLEPGMAVLDLACGKGELLCQWAARYGVRGRGIEIHPPFVELARQRAHALGVANSVGFAVGDAGAHDETGRYDVVSCIGATWIAGGLEGTVRLMARSMQAGGRLLVGEPFLEPGATPSAVDAHPGLSDLTGILDRIEELGLELSEMVMATREDWDMYESRQWAMATAWLTANAEADEAADVRDYLHGARREYITTRGSVGWAVFVLE